MRRWSKELILRADCSVWCRSDTESVGLDYWLERQAEFKLLGDGHPHHRRSVMKYFVGLMVLVLLVLHQDYWNWFNGSLVFGFLPYSMAYHCMISLAAAVVWCLAVKFCWPDHLTANLDDDSQGDPS